MMIKMSTTVPRPMYMTGHCPSTRARIHQRAPYLGGRIERIEGGIVWAMERASLVTMPYG